MAIAASVAAFAYLIIGVVGGTLKHDDYGVVPIPGGETVTLEAGTVAVFYQERAHLSENESLDVPEFGLDVRRRGDAPVELEDEGAGSSYELNDLAGTQIAKIEVEEEGEYTVRTRGQVGRREPEVSFGKEIAVGRLLLVSAAILLAGGLLGALLFLIGNARRTKQPLEPAGAAPVERSAWAATASAAQPGPSTPPPPTAPQPPPHQGLMMPPEPSAAPKDPAERLRELDGRRAAGQVTQAQYDAERAAILEEL